MPPAAAASSPAVKKRKRTEDDSSGSTSPAVDVATASQSSSSALVSERIERLLEEAGAASNDTKTKAGWCLRQGLCHIGSLDDELLHRICHHGVPTFYLRGKSSSSARQCRHEATQDLKDPQTCFQSLCRIVAGQFVSGKSAQAAWKRLLQLSGDDKDLQPQTIISLCSDKNCEESFQKSAGLTKAKARSILDLAERFNDERLSEAWLQSSSEQDVRQALLQVKGIGDWSCDMFLLFYLERPNVLPLGDLGIRKGIGRYLYGWRSGTNNKKKQQLCPKKDAERVMERLQPFAPYLSLLSYYMWRVADTPDIPQPPAAAQKSEQKQKTVNHVKEREEDDKKEEEDADAEEVTSEPSQSCSTPRKSPRLEQKRAVTP